jgi:hypothetical protein
LYHPAAGSVLVRPEMYAKCISQKSFLFHYQSYLLI